MILLCGLHLVVFNCGFVLVNFTRIFQHYLISAGASYDFPSASETSLKNVGNCGVQGPVSI